MRAFFPEYGQIGLLTISWFTSQLERLLGSKFIQPLTHTSGSLAV
jgi:hypothetical protein